MFSDIHSDGDEFREVLVESLLEAFAEDLLDLSSLLSETRKLGLSKGQVKQLLIRHDLFNVKDWEST